MRGKRGSLNKRHQDRVPGEGVSCGDDWMVVEGAGRAVGWEGRVGGRDQGIVHVIFPETRVGAGPSYAPTGLVSSSSDLTGSVGQECRSSSQRGMSYTSASARFWRRSRAQRGPVEIDACWNYHFLPFVSKEITRETVGGGRGSRVTEWVGWVGRGRSRCRSRRKERRRRRTCVKGTND